MSKTIHPDYRDFFRRLPAIQLSIRTARDQGLAVALDLLLSLKNSLFRDFLTFKRLEDYVQQFVPGFTMHGFYDYLVAEGYKKIEEETHHAQKKVSPANARRGRAPVF